MNKEEYKNLVTKYSYNPNVFQNALVSFISGGVLGGFGEILTSSYMKLLNLDVTKALTLTSITYIIVACLLTGFGKFDDLVKKYKFGLIIPITGFAHSVASSLMDYRKDGLITGMGSNMFKLAGSVILYGTITAILCALLKGLIYG